MSTATDVATFEPELWSRRIVERLTERSVVLSLVGHAWEDGPHGSEDVGIYFAFLCDAIERAQADPAEMDVYLRRAIIAVDNALTEKILTFGRDHGADVGNWNSMAFPAFFRKIGEKLDECGLPDDGRRWAILNPDSSARLALEDTNAADRPTTPGFAGRFAGFNVFHSSCIPTIDGMKTLLFGHPDSIRSVARIADIVTTATTPPPSMPDVESHTAIQGTIWHGVSVPDACRGRLVAVKARV